MRKNNKNIDIIQDLTEDINPSFFRTKSKIWIGLSSQSAGY